MNAFLEVLKDDLLDLACILFILGSVTRARTICVGLGATNIIIDQLFILLFGDLVDSVVVAIE